MNLKWAYFVSGRLYDTSGSKKISMASCFCDKCDLKESVETFAWRYETFLNIALCKIVMNKFKVYSTIIMFLLLVLFSIEGRCR